MNKKIVVVAILIALILLQSYAFTLRKCFVFAEETADSIEEVIQVLYDLVSSLDLIIDDYLPNAEISITVNELDEARVILSGAMWVLDTVAGSLDTLQITLYSLLTTMQSSVLMQASVLLSEADVDLTSGAIEVTHAEISLLENDPETARADIQEAIYHLSLCKNALLTARQLLLESLYGSLHIYVMNPDNKAISGAIVQAEGPESVDGTSDANGFVAFGNIKIGSYIVIAAASEYSTESKLAAVYEGQITTITITLTPIHVRFSPLIDGYSFDNWIPKESVSFWDALEAISSASWSSSVPSTYWPILAWLSLAVHNLQFGNCFGMSYTAKYYYQNPLLFVSNYPSYSNLYEVGMPTASPEIVTNQFPGQLIISPYLINIAIISLGLSSLNEQIPWILSQLDDYHVVQLYLARPILDSNILHVFHSVLVYDYELVGNQVRLHVYDPNHGGDTRYVVLSKDEYENYEILGGNAIIEYDVTQIAAGEFHDMGWSLLAGYINELVQLVYEIVTLYCDDFLGFEAKSPVNMLITAPDGLRVGYDSSTQSEVNEISGATYSGAGSEPQTILIPSPLLGNCTVDIFGTGTGDYEITVESKAPGGTVVKPLTLSGTASEGKLDTYSIELTEDYTPIPEFPSLLVLPLFMITTLLAVIVYRRRHIM